MTGSKAPSINFRVRVAEDNPRLVEIWLDAVRATHDFITEDDIQIFLPQVRDDYLPTLEVVVAEIQCRPVGFAGLDGSKLEMLFVDPAHHGAGIGKTLVGCTSAMNGPLTVDVNEQNPAALAFYLKCGFKQTGRSALDGSGRPFPLLHLSQAA